MIIIPLDKLEKLRIEQGKERPTDRPALQLPVPEHMPEAIHSGSVEPTEDETGAAIIDFTL